MILAQPTVYLETTIISYLAARPSRDLIVAAHQQVTREWWEGQRQRYALFVSELVVREASGGDAEAAARRLDIMHGLPLLDLSTEARDLSEAILTAGLVPSRYAEDAVHIALAARHGMDFLLTWNCAHLANPTIRRNLELYLMRRHLRPPIICTPVDMLEE